MLPYEAPEGFRLNTLRRGRVCRFNSMLHLKMNIKLPTVALAALLFAGLLLASSSAQIGLSVAIAPPPIPVYEQPLCPTEGYLWTPGYWGYADSDYYWVPGVWVPPPGVGVLWTPGYWGYNNGLYVFNEGYWGPTVGFYGGINYGFGYVGHGYYGGQWVGNSFRYNTAVTRVNTTVIHNTYVNNKFVNTITGSRASFNGPGGAKAKPTAKEQAAAKAEHVPPTPEQRSRVEAAKNNPDLHAANNHGKPEPEAIKALDRNNGQQPAAAAAGGPAGTEQAGAQKQAGTENAKGRAAQAANGSHPAAKAAQTQQAAQHAQVVSHRPQPARVPQAAPAAHGRASAPAAQPAKKKKPAKDAPGGER